MEEAEVRSAARQMIWLHGSRAKDQAGERADKRFSIGDMAGFREWNCVTDAIKDLERKAHAPANPD